MFLGLASGKLGDVVFARAKGQQIARVRVVPKNPRTGAQQAQRVRLAAVAALYRSAREVLKDTFTIRHGFESSYNAFSRNAIGIAPFFTRQMVDNCLALPIPAQASRGALQPVRLNRRDNFERLPNYSLTATDTMGSWSEKFLEKNPTYSNGDKVVYVIIKFEPNTEVPLANAYNAKMRTIEIEIDTTSTQTIAEAGFSIDETATQQGYMSVVAWPDIVFSGDGLDDEGLIVQSAGIGVSRSKNGELLTSSEYFGLNTGAKALYDEFRSESALQAAIDSYGAVNDTALSV